MTNNSSDPTFYLVFISRGRRIIFSGHGPSIKLLQEYTGEDQVSGKRIRTHREYFLTSWYGRGRKSCQDRMIATVLQRALFSFSFCHIFLLFISASIYIVHTCTNCRIFLMLSQDVEGDIKTLLINCVNWGGHFRSNTATLFLLVVIISAYFKN